MTPYVAAETEGAVFLVPTIADASKLFIGNARRAEFVCLARACAVLRDAGRMQERSTIVDIGAHIGTTTIPALTGHGFAHAVAVEPDPENLSLLRANAALNGVDEQVTVIFAAIASSPGPRWLVERRRERGRWAHSKLSDKPAPDGVPLDAVTLDGLVETGAVDPRATGLLWVGRGLDEQTLLTASRFVEQRVPIVFVYRKGRFAGSGSPFLRQLEEHGYTRALDLRRPSLDEPLSDWQPESFSIAEIATLVPRKSVTDVLAF